MPSPPLQAPDIFKPMKIGAAIVAGFAAGKFAAPWGGAHSSEVFGAAFLAGVIAMQGLFRLLDLWREKSRRRLSD
jgi:hypothetical protein